MNKPADLQGNTTIIGDNTTHQIAYGLRSVLTSLPLQNVIGGLPSGHYILESFKIMTLGFLMDLGRMIFAWVTQKFQFRYNMTASFEEGDPAYEWLTFFLIEENVWTASKDFNVCASSGKRRWAVRPASQYDNMQPSLSEEASADYVPAYGASQVFRWKGYWIEITRNMASANSSMASVNSSMASVNSSMRENQFIGMTSLTLILYTRKMNVLTDLVEEARRRYLSVTKEQVTIHCLDASAFGSNLWSRVTTKAHRSLDSIILEGDLLESLVEDAQEFFELESWYQNAGIPHRRGYLLHGPPGCGKTSTIFAIASAMNLEIYVMSLSSNKIDDVFFQRAISAIPKRSILVIEDIDCAFPPRKDADDEHEDNMLSYNRYSPYSPPIFYSPPRSLVTLSGLLNAIDGVATEDGRLFFATTNHIDNLDPALLRPGRIDRQIEYKLTTYPQAAALYKRFFSAERSTNSNSKVAPKSYTDSVKLLNQKFDAFIGDKEKWPERLNNLAEQWASKIPPNQFSTAELQGYLLMCKLQPLVALERIEDWVLTELRLKKEKQEREADLKRKMKEKIARSNKGIVGEAVAAALAHAPVPSVGGPIGSNVPIITESLWSDYQTTTCDKADSISSVITNLKPNPETALSSVSLHEVAANLEPSAVQ